MARRLRRERETSPAPSTRSLTLEEAAMERERLSGTMAGETMDPAKGSDTGGSDMNIPQKKLSEEGQEMIREGHVYKEKNGLQEVIPFFVDLARATVRFAPIGRASEDEMRTSDFLNRFEYVGPQSETLADKTPVAKADEKK